MNVHRLNALVKRAIRKQLQADGDQGGLNHWQPELDERLDLEYGMDQAMRHGTQAFINQEFHRDGNPIHPQLLGSETRRENTARGMASLVKPRFGLSILVVIFVGVLALGRAEANSFHIQDFNSDETLELVSYEELRLYLIYNTKMSIAEFDAEGNLNGVLDGAEIDAYNRKLEESVSEKLNQFFYSIEEDRLLTENPVPLNEMLDGLNLERKVKPVPLTPEEIARQAERDRLAEKQDFDRSAPRLHIRSKGTDVSIRNGALDTAAANLGYEVDNNTNIQTGKIDGAVGFLVGGRLKPARADRSRGPVLDEYAFGGSVQVNRTFDNRGRAFEKDKLVFRMGGDLSFSGDSKRSIPTQFFSNWVRYETNSRFENTVFGLETIYEPYFRELAGLYAFANSNQKLISRLTPTLRSNYTHVSEDPNNTYLVDEFWNLGFGLNYALTLTDNNDRVARFVSTYEHFWDVLGTGSETYNWINELQFPLANRNGLEVSLTATHELSKDDTRGDRENEYKLGIGVKY